MDHKILKIFSPTVVPLIRGTGIDRPMNALILTNLARNLFSEFTFAFEHIGPYTYRFKFVDEYVDIRLAGHFGDMSMS